MVGTAMRTPVDTTYLADNVLMFRYFESFGQVRRAISVVKKRSGAHELTIRELSMGPRVFRSARRSRNSRAFSPESRRSMATGPNCPASGVGNDE
jgi:hypothetical protein